MNLAIVKFRKITGVLPVACVLLAITVPVYGAVNRNWNNYCATFTTYLRQQTTATSEFSELKPEDFISKQSLYLPFGSLAIAIPDKSIYKVRVIGRVDQGQAPMLAFYGRSNKLAFTMGMVRVGPAENIGGGISWDLAAQLQSLFNHGEILHTPLSHQFWATLAAKYYPTGLSLMKGIEGLDINSVNCNSPTEMDWVVLYGLYARSLLMPYQSELRFEGLWKTNADDVHVLIEKYSAKTVYLLTRDGRSYVQVVVLNNGVGSTTIAAIDGKKSNVHWQTSNPTWADSILRAMLHHEIATPSSWEKLLHRLSASGLKAVKG